MSTRRCDDDRSAGDCPPVPCAKFRDGYRVAATDKEMREAAADPTTTRRLGIFHPGNMDGVLDRKFLHKLQIRDSFSGATALV